MPSACTCQVRPRRRRTDGSWRSRPRPGGAQRVASRGSRSDGRRRGGCRDGRDVRRRGRVRQRGRAHARLLHLSELARQLHARTGEGVGVGTRRAPRGGLARRTGRAGYVGRAERRRQRRCRRRARGGRASRGGGASRAEGTAGKSPLPAHPPSAASLLILPWHLPLVLAWHLLSSPTFSTCHPHPPLASRRPPRRRRARRPLRTRSCPRARSPPPSGSPRAAASAS